MLFKPNASSGVPIYLQLMEQIKHAIGTRALRPGDQLPGLRRVAEELVVNPNTVAKAYRELEHEGMIELRQGAGAFITESSLDRSSGNSLRKALPLVHSLVTRLALLGLNEEEIRRLVEAELTRLRDPGEPGMAPQSK